MHFAEELVKPDSLQIPGHVDIGAKELEMARELVDRMTGEWEPTNIHRRLSARSARTN